MNKNLLLSSLLLSSALFYAGCMKKTSPVVNTSSIKTPTVQEQPIPITEAVSQYIPQSKYRQMKTVQGGSITVGEHERGFEFPQYKGKIVLLELFGKNCHYCFEEMPTITKLQSAYQDRISVIGIQSAPPMAEGEAQRLIQQHNMNYPIVDQDEAKSILIYLRDVYGWMGILPYILLIKDGQIEQVFQGADHSFAEISEGIQDIK